MALASFYFEWDSPLALIHRDKIKLQTCASYEFFVQGLKNKLGKSNFLTNFLRFSLKQISRKKLESHIFNLFQKIVWQFVLWGMSFQKKTQLTNKKYRKV